MIRKTDLEFIIEGSGITILNYDNQVLLNKYRFYKELIEENLELWLLDFIKYKRRMIYLNEQVSRLEKKLRSLGEKCAIQEVVSEIEIQRAVQIRSLIYLNVLSPFQTSMSTNIPKPSVNLAKS